MLQNRHKWAETGHRIFFLIGQLRRVQKPVVYYRISRLEQSRHSGISESSSDDCLIRQRQRRATYLTQKGAPLVLFAIPDEETKENKFAIEVPKLASLILTHDLNGELKGLDEFDGNHPPVTPVFFSFRVMVGIGLLMLAVAWWCAFSLKKQKRLSPFQLKILIAMTFSGWIATLAGWYVTEIGRQPYLVHGVLKTSEAVTTIASTNVAITLAVYLIIYAVLLIAYVKTLFALARKAVDVEEYDMSFPGLPEKKASYQNKEISAC